MKHRYFLVDQDVATEAPQGVQIPQQLSNVIEKLERFKECADDFEGTGCDIGRHWLDVLTTLGLLERVQRSPALWQMTDAGDKLLTAAAQPSQNTGTIGESQQQPSDDEILKIAATAGLVDLDHDGSCRNGFQENAEVSRELLAFAHALISTISTAPLPVAHPGDAGELLPQACDKPLLGWQCTRPIGHDGPCAAVRTPEDVAIVERGMRRLRNAGYFDNSVQSSGNTNELLKVTLPKRPNPVYPAGTTPSFGEVDCDCYSAVQVLEYGRACAEAQRKADAAQTQAHATPVWKDHNTAQLVNQLTEIARSRQLDSGDLRDRISRVVNKAIAANPAR